MELWDLRELNAKCSDVAEKEFPSALKSCLGAKGNYTHCLIFFSMYLFYVNSEFYANSREPVCWRSFLEICGEYKRKHNTKLLLPRVFLLFFSAGLCPTLSDEEIQLDPDKTRRVLLDIKESLRVIDVDNQLTRAELIPSFLDGEIPFTDRFIANSE